MSPINHIEVDKAALREVIWRELLERDLIQLCGQLHQMFLGDECTHHACDIIDHAQRGHAAGIISADGCKSLIRFLLSLRIYDGISEILIIPNKVKKYANVSFLTLAYCL